MSSFLDVTYRFNVANDLSIYRSVSICREEGTPTAFLTLNPRNPDVVDPLAFAVSSEAMACEIMATFGKHLWPIEKDERSLNENGPSETAFNLCKLLCQLVTEPVAGLEPV